MTATPAPPLHAHAHRPVTSALLRGLAFYCQSGAITEATRDMLAGLAQVGSGRRVGGGSVCGGGVGVSECVEGVWG